MNNLGIRCYVFGKDVRREAKPNGRSIRKTRNAADARIRNNSLGLGRFWCKRCSSYLLTCSKYQLAICITQ